MGGEEEEEGVERLRLRLTPDVVVLDVMETDWACIGVYEPYET